MDEKRGGGEGELLQTNSSHDNVNEKNSILFIVSFWAKRFRKLDIHIHQYSVSKL